MIENTTEGHGPQLPDTAPVDAPAKRRSASRERLLAAARKLFVEKGFHATRPQDIARAAEVGHGTFYLHFADKRACFLAFVEDARSELSLFVNQRASGAATFEAMIEAVLTAIFDYNESHPGVLATAMADDVVIGHDGPDTQPPLLVRWGMQWGDILKAAPGAPRGWSDQEREIAGQAIVGAIHQASSYAYRKRMPRGDLIKSLTRFLSHALTA